MTLSSNDLFTTGYNYTDDSITRVISGEVIHQYIAIQLKSVNKSYLYPQGQEIAVKL